MRRANIVGAMISTAIGLFIVTQAAQLEYWTSMGPGPGFVPLWAGIGISLAGIVLLVQILRSPSDEKEATGEKGRFGVVGFVAVMTMLAAEGMNILGFTITTFLFLVILIGMSRKHRLPTVIGVAGGVTITFLLVFKWGLQVPLPTGYIGF